MITDASATNTSTQEGLYSMESSATLAHLSSQLLPNIRIFNLALRYFKVSDVTTLHVPLLSAAVVDRCVRYV